MKYVIIIADGAADYPLEELGEKTPFEVAAMPHTHRLAKQGRVGTAVTTPAGLKCGSDVCCMSVLGYNPQQYYTGRAPLEAAAMGIELSPSDWIFRVNLVTVIDGFMQDHSAGHISSDEGRQLLKDFAANWAAPEASPEASVASQALEALRMKLYPGVSYRNILVDSSGSGNSGGRDWSGLVTMPPHDMLGQPIRKHLPTGSPHAKVLQKLIADSEAMFAGHEINMTRRELGESPATHLWPWGQGRMPSLPSFESRYGLRGAVITAVDLLAGIAALIGWDRLDVPGQTSYHDTDYQAAGRHAVAALEAYDVVCVHVEAPDEAAHAGDASTKVAAIEAIDRYVVGPIHEGLEKRGSDWRILYLPDHYTRVSTRMHDPTPVPFVICGKRVQGLVEQPFSERTANESDLHIAYGHELMEYFLYGGLQDTRREEMAIKRR